jgi:hypothetical protein
MMAAEEEEMPSAPGSDAEKAVPGKTDPAMSHGGHDRH